MKGIEKFINEYDKCKTQNDRAKLLALYISDASCTKCERNDYCCMNGPVYTCVYNYLVNEVRR